MPVHTADSRSPLLYDSITGKLVGYTDNTGVDRDLGGAVLDHANPTAMAMVALTPTGLAIGGSEPTSAQKVQMRAGIGFKSGLDYFDGGVPLGRPSGLSISSKAVTSHMVRMALIPQTALIGIAVYFDNPGSVDITIKSAIELQSGTKIQLTFPDGTTSRTIKPGEVVKTNIVPIEYSGPSTPPVSADALYLRTYVTLASGNMACRSSTLFGDLSQFPAGLRDSWADNGGVDRTLLDNTGLGTSNGYIYAPLAVVGKSSYSGDVYVSFGDSIANGQEDSSNLSSGGWIARYCVSKKVPFLQLGYPGRGVPTFDPVSDPAKVINLTYGATHAVCQFGTNDMINGVALALIQARMTAFWKHLAAAGIDVKVATLPPRTSSTDGFVTEVNQTPNGANFVGGVLSIRHLYNEWLRSFPQYVSEVLDVALAVESENTIGIWKAGYTGDGTHPKTIGYVAMAAQAAN